MSDFDHDWVRQERAEASKRILMCVPRDHRPTTLTIAESQKGDTLMMTWHVDTVGLVRWAIGDLATSPGFQSNQTGECRWLALRRGTEYQLQLKSVAPLA